MEQLQSHIWLAASSDMVKYLRISSLYRKPFLIYDFATSPLRISLYMRNLLSVYCSFAYYSLSHSQRTIRHIPVNYLNLSKERKWKKTTCVYYATFTVCTPYTLGFSDFPRSTLLHLILIWPWNPKTSL
jgi:hypothetical protein